MSLLLVVFFFSGFSSLIYQVVWQKALSQVIGLDHYSVTLIVSIFMLGLGLGGALGGRLCRSRIRLVHLYMFIEFILGAFGFLSLIIIRGANAYFQSFGFGYVFDFLINFIVLILPTLLMGMSFPIMLHIYRNVFPVGRAVGIVYSANIIGAAAGALVTGFLLIGTIGMSSSCHLAAFINVALGLVVFIAFNFIRIRGKDLANAGEAINLQNQKSPAVDIRFLTLSFIVGFVALSYEIIFFRIFTTYFGANVYVFPILLFSYLAMMAVGNRYYGQKADKSPSEFLFVSMAVFAILTTLMVLWGQEIAYRVGFRQNYFVFWSFRTWLAFAQIVPILVISFVLMAPIAFISGFFPVIIKSAARNPEQLGAVAGKLYFTQTLGNFMGTIITGLVLLPAVGTVMTLKIAAGLLGVCIVVANWGKNLSLFLSKKWLIAMVVAFVAVSIYPNYYNSVRFYSEKDKRLIQSPSVVREGAFGVTLGYAMNNQQMHVYSGRMFSNSFPLKSLMLSNVDDCFPMDWIASIKGLEVKRILYIGLGSGVGIFCLNKFFPNAKIDVVEINPELVGLMEDYANDVILDIMQKSNIYITDGRRFVSKEKSVSYDLIHMGVFNAWCSGCGNVFTKEFLQMLKNHLSPNGVVTYNAYPPAVKAGLGVFENLVIFSPGLSRISEVCASSKRIELDPDKFNKNLQNLLQESGPGSVRINWKYIREGVIIPKEKVVSFLGGISESTDDKPVTEYFLTNNQFTYLVDWKVFKPKKDMRIFECSDCARPPFIDVDNGVRGDSR